MFNVKGLVCDILYVELPIFLFPAKVNCSIRVGKRPLSVGICVPDDYVTLLENSKEHWTQFNEESQERT